MIEIIAAPIGNVHNQAHNVSQRRSDAMHDLLISCWNPIRWIHILSAAAWFGEVAVINFVLIPAMRRYQGEARTMILKLIFPRIFRLASILAATAVLTGSLLVYLTIGGELARLTTGRWGLSILTGGSLAWLIAIFHFFIEDKLSRHAGFDPDASETALADMHLKLTIVPRVAMAALSAIFILMMIAARGI